MERRQRGGHRQEQAAEDRRPQPPAAPRRIEHRRRASQAVWAAGRFCRCRKRKAIPQVAATTAMETKTPTQKTIRPSSRIRTEARARRKRSQRYPFVSAALALIASQKPSFVSARIGKVNDHM